MDHHLDSALGGAGRFMADRVIERLLHLDRQVLELDVERAGLAERVCDADVGVNQVITAAHVTRELHSKIGELDLLPEDHSHRCATPMTISVPEFPGQLMLRTE